MLTKESDTPGRDFTGLKEAFEQKQKGGSLESPVKEENR